MTEVDPDADREAALKRGQTTMVRSASRWMQDALTAWAEDDFPKVATLAPLAVEHLGKAALWNANPALLVPLSQDAEAAHGSGGGNRGEPKASLGSCPLRSCLGR